LRRKRRGIASAEVFVEGGGTPALDRCGAGQRFPATPKAGRLALAYAKGARHHARPGGSGDHVHRKKRKPTFSARQAVFVAGRAVSEID